MSGLPSRSTIEELQAEIAQTTLKLRRLQAQLHSLTQSPSPQPDTATTCLNSSTPSLALEDYVRYGRQMILPIIGLSGQLKLRDASVLVIGAGGLGCPALLYLARAGVGRIAIVDHDTVELSNLHRQILHTTATVGMNKAASAKIGLLSGTPGLQIETYAIPFAAETILNSSKGSLPPLNNFQLVLDCTDNSQARYLISDACAAKGITLVSGAAIRTSGQLSVWNLPLECGRRGPCYRCIFPVPPEELREQRCEDEGVLGPVVGLVGVLMALEAVELLVGAHNCVPKLLLVPSFRSVKLRNAQPHCQGCGHEAKMHFFQRLRQQSAPKPCVRPVLPPGTVPQFIRISPTELKAGARNLEDFEIIDVRPPTEFSICSLPRSINLPITDFLQANHHAFPKRPILFVCRRGNDSQLAAQAVGGLEVYDLEGGLAAYAKQVDHSFPIY